MRPKAEDLLAMLDTGRRTGPVTAAAVPAKLGRYQIVHQLGKGAMGIVYRALDPMINREVALKVIPLATEFDADQLDEARAKFFREAEMAGRLNHPHIVTIYDAGEDNGTAYIAMELLRGRHLVDHTSEPRLLPVPATLELGARIADALHYAHQRQVIHRDIKPANVMYDAPSGQLKITDFGIARLTDSGRTRTGIVLGTPSFMSPEQLQGRTLTGQSDVFSLGVTLYQLLTARLPFRADSMPALMMKIAMEPHPRVRAMRPDLPEGIDQLMDRALAKDLSERFYDGAEMAAALRALATQAGA
jgi:serine/threonine-protein kinase